MNALDVIVFLFYVVLGFIGASILVETLLLLRAKRRAAEILLIQLRRAERWGRDR